MWGQDATRHDAKHAEDAKVTSTPAKKREPKAKEADLKGELTRTAKPKEVAPEASAPEASAAAGPATAAKPKRAAKPKAEGAEKAAPKGPKYPGPVVRLVFPIGTYSANKDAVKAVLKEFDLKFQYMGAGQARYYDDRVTIFAKWGDVHADYTIRGDAAIVEKISTAWKTLGATDFTEEGKAQEESEALKAWRLEEPQPRPGEPEFFLKKRRAEWEARDPRKGG